MRSDALNECLFRKLAIYFMVLHDALRLAILLWTKCSFGLQFAYNFCYRTGLCLRCQLSVWLYYLSFAFPAIVFEVPSFKVLF